jgi:HAE1 family hydrophobic/amphiphilic exporter-1
VLSWARLRRYGMFGRLWRGLTWLVFLPFAVAGQLIAQIGLLLAFIVGALFRIGAWITRGVLWPAARGFQKAYGALENAYVPFLRGCLRARGIVVMLALAALVFAGWRATTLSPDLIPEALTGEFEMKVSFVPGTPLESTAQRVRRAEQAIRAVPGVEWTATTVGVEADADRAADEGEHTATIAVHLTRAAQLAGSERSVQREVEAILRRQPDAQSQLLPSSLFRFALPLKLVFFGGGESDLGRISRAAEQTALIVRDFPGVTSVRVGHGRGAREVRLKFDRDALFRFGLTAEEVATRVQGKLTGRIPTSLVEGSARTDVRVRIAEDDRASVRDLKELDVADPGAGSLPLRMVLAGDPVVAEGPGEVRRVGGRHAATIEADYEGLQLDRVAKEAAAAAKPIAERFGVDVRVLGRSEEAQRSSRALFFAMLLAVFLVYAVMAAQFESLIQPLLIMAALPLAGVGAVLLLDLLGLPLSVVVLLGSILLVGIAVNNAIVLLDCMNRRIREGASKHDAILGAAQERLRPILMTTLTTILGLVPLTGLLASLPGADALPLGLGGGEAAELRSPMAITVIGGLISSTVLTLVVVPVLYDLAVGRRKPA